jgi:energy-coupling factor transporter ATP-binding protein EcfA2
MSTRSSLQNEILKFATGLPYWEQYLAEFVLVATSEKQEADLVRESLRFLLEDAKLAPHKDGRPELRFEPTPGDESESPKAIAGLRFKSLANVKNVNAIKQSKSLDFSANLTVVYGKNGAGKSGFIRLLNNAFYSRGDRQILPNVFETGTEKPEADFEFQQGANPAYTLKYPLQSERTEFGQYAVFDSKSVHVHLNERNELHIEPLEFDFFGKLAMLVEKVEEQFDSLIEKGSKPNEFLKRFDGESEVTNLLRDLNGNTDLEPIRALAAMKGEDDQSLIDAEKQLSELHVDQVTKKKQELTAVRSRLSALQQELKRLTPLFESATLDALKADISSCNAIKAQIEASGVQQFKDDRFLGIGSPQWLNFIKAAHEFSTLQHADHPRDGEPCPLCYRALEQSSTALIRSYWTFLEGKLEADLRAVESRISELENRWSRAVIPALPADSQASMWLSTSGLPLATHLMSNLGGAGALLTKLKEITKSKSWEDVDALPYVPDTLFDEVTAAIDKRILELDADAVKAQETILKALITLLGHRRKLSEALSEIEAYVRGCAWVALATVIRKKVGTRDITNRRKELYEQHLNGRYTARFHQWCTELKTPYPIDIKQKGGTGKSERQLMIRGKYTPSQVLSEGEQRAIALADFFTEVEIADIPSGLIFDDPVNSQDLDRKELIAKKIVEESKTKQIIVFTHDLSFVFDLKNEALRAGRTYACHWVEKNQLDSGIVHNNLEPSLEKGFVEPSEAAEYLRKAQSESNPKEREGVVRHGLSLLRSSYEALVIHDVLGGCISRFDREFKWKRLQDAYLDQEFIERVFEKMGMLSGYVEAHLHSDRTSSVPTSDLLEEEIKSYKKLREEFSTKRRQYKKGLEQIKKQPAVVSD